MTAIPNLDTTNREIVVTRLIDAPRELVYRAWTDHEHITNWWGPVGFTTTTHAVDFRVGGEWRFVMHGPDGRDYPNRVTYLEIAPPERLVYNHAGEEDDLVKFQSTVTFTEEDGKTRVTLQLVFETAAMRNEVVEKYGAVEGGFQTLARLDDYVTTTAPFEISREFDAPRDLVYRAWTEEERLARWWGPKGFDMLSCKLDLRPGGMFHYGMRGPDGKEMWGKWVFREVTPPGRIAFVSSFSDKDGGITRAPFLADWPLEVFSTVTFTEIAGKTTIRMTAVPVNPTDTERNVFQSMFDSMRGGWKGTLDQLTAFLANG